MTDEYEYEGETAEALVAAYDADASPFPTDDDRRYPRRDHLRDEPTLLKSLLFPRCWNATDLVDDPAAVRERLTDLGQCVYAGVTAYGDEAPGALAGVVDDLLDALPGIRERLKRDAEAAYKGDPAAKSYCEIIRSYPGFQATVVHRVAHELYAAGHPEYARELAEYAKSETGIDIHPGATVGDHFFIDHGTGVVIGETATIGDWARIYQNVTLGALPDLGDHVVVGAGSNVLGPVEIGDHVSIGANAWVTEDVDSHTTVFVADHPEQTQKPTD